MGNIESRNDIVKTVRKRDKSNFSRIGHPHVKTNSVYPDFEIAQEFPEAYVYGIDIISSFPSDIKPSNCYFKECNISDGLPFSDNEFDYVFMRHMFLALKNHQWVPLLNEIMRVLKPGGIVEFVEFDLIPLARSVVVINYEFIFSATEIITVAENIKNAVMP
ncbi:4475_t:CDS:2 [Racocetra fulgida]|uniref:4475_t:CDS:1 n=1 Tax=Racocetra fulgida TaxID=60492 RepID=A0A9N9AYG6_9GLOM|nr:4475_t:CDS:2 [Racocetra fulgida]